MFKRVLSFVLAIVLTMGLVLLAPPVEAQAASTMSPSDEVANYLRETEGFAAIPFWDYNQWTVGFGTRCPEEHFERYSREGIPVAEAHALFASYLAGVAGNVNKFLQRRGLTLNQHQFDALVCLTYNKGSAWLGMENEPVTLAVMAGDLGNRFVAAISLTCYAGGNFLPGLMRRRLAEADMYLNGNYSRVHGDNYCYVRYDGNGGEVSRTVQGYNVDLPVEFYCVATYTGHTFLGWFTEPEGGTQITELSRETDEMILYAHWEEGGEDIPFESFDVTVTTYQLNVRAKPGSQHAVVGYVYNGSVLTLLGIQEEEGMPWGRIENGWINLAYTDYRVPVIPQEPVDPPVTEPDTPPVQPDDDTPPAEEVTDKDATFPDRLPFTGTVVGTDTLNTYNGPHNGYPKVSTLSPGDRITVLETYELFGVLWGRTESGWVRMDHCILFDGYQLLAHSFTATVRTNGLSVRSGPGTNFTRIAYVNNGTRVTVTAVVRDGERSWGLYENGWICLDFTDYDSEKLSFYKEHSFGDWSLYQDSTCAVFGQERRPCVHCDHYEVKYIPKKPHTYGRWYTGLEATCVTPGQELRDCVDCGHQEKRNTSLGDHSCGEWQSVSAASCTKPGQDRRECAWCDYYETRVTAMLPHAMGDWYTAKEPTDLVTGISRRDCRDCGYFEETILPVTEHVYGDWYVSLAPTCTAEGVQRRDCKNCVHFDTRPISAKGHTMSGWTESAAPTCVQAGTEIRTCKDCDHSDTRSIPATGKHSYGSWQVTVEATTTQEGQQRRDCRHCDAFQTEVIPCKPAVVERVYGTLTGWHYVNVRSGPGTNYSRVTTLNYGDRVEILEQANVNGILWGRYEGGWVCITDYLTLETVREEPELPEEPGDYIVIVKTFGTLTGWHTLNVRQGPGTGYPKVGTLSYGDRVEILEQANVNGILWGRYEGGWVCITDYLTLETVEEKVEKPSQPEEPEVPEEPEQPDIPEEPETPAEPEKPAEPEVKTYGTLTGWHTLNVRQGPGTGYPKVGTLSYGDRVEILEQENVGGILWGRYHGGWVCITDYLTLTTVTQEPEDPIPSKPNIPQPGEKTFAIITTSSLNVRQGPGVQYDRIGYLTYGMRVEIYEQRELGGAIWGRCDKGWICLTDYTRLETEKPAEPETSKVVMVVATDVLNVRAGAGMNYGVLSTLRMGDEVIVLEEKYIDNRVWAHIAQGWVAKEYLTTSN